MQNKIKNLRNWGCDIDGALDRFLNDDDLYKECLEMFLEDENLFELKKHINDTDQSVPFSIVHALKGVSGNLGLTPLFETLSVLCESLRDNSYNPKSGEFEKVQDNIDNFIKIMS